jgi:hypothetical protein
VSTGADTAISREQGRVRQRKEICVIRRGWFANDESMRANACERQGRIISLGAMTTRTSVNGTPMTRCMKHLPENEKDRCANTGLLQEVSLVVTVGIRSDRRQTA